VVTPVRDPGHQQVLDRVLEDTIGAPDAWHLGSDGRYVRGDEVVGVAGLERIT
jgi:hypothetical protein